MVETTNIIKHAPQKYEYEQYFYHNGYGTKKYKTLILNTSLNNGIIGSKFRVELNEKLILSTPIFQDAINKYNEL